jgi:integrase
MRENECCQLDVADVSRADGVDVFHIRASESETGDKKVKTRNAERIVPIHPELERLGFLDYVLQMREAGERKLFPELSLGAKGYYSDPFQKWFGRFLESAKAKRPKTSFHSFRHNFRDALREANVPVERARVIGGWADDGGADAGYGSGFKPSTLAVEIAKVSYPGLDLRHLYPEQSQVLRRRTRMHRKVIQPAKGR